MTTDTLHRFGLCKILLLIVFLTTQPVSLYAQDEVSENARRVLSKIELARETNATSLDLNIDIDDGIPLELYTLTQLEQLEIVGIFQSGDENSEIIISPAIGDLTNLHFLKLSGLRLTTLPDEIGQLSQLETLDISNNEITELPDGLRNLTNLTLLDAFSNSLNRLPTQISQLTQLNRLNLGGNNLSELSSDIANLTQLQWLNLSPNSLRELPPEIGNLTQLMVLDVSRNELIEFPEEIGNLTQLTRLTFSSNNLRTLPEEIGNLTQLQSVSLYDNPFRRLPKSFYDVQEFRSSYVRSFALPLLLIWDIDTVEGRDYVTNPNRYHIPILISVALIGVLSAVAIVGNIAIRRTVYGACKWGFISIGISILLLLIGGFLYWFIGWNGFLPANISIKSTPFLFIIGAARHWYMHKTSTGLYRLDKRSLKKHNLR